MIAGFLLAAGALSVWAAPRTSANYSVTAEVEDCGGRRTTNTTYEAAHSVGGIFGISTNATPDITVKIGYIAQVADDPVKTVFIFR
jgi:hypothetical protein